VSIWIGIAALVALGGLAAFVAPPPEQRADRRFAPRIARPAHSGASAPLVAIDAGHFNSHTRRGLLSPFARLIAADGCRTRSISKRFTSRALQGFSVLVIANAAGGLPLRVWGRPVFGLHRGGAREDAAFTAGEVAAVKAWVEGGGSLLLIADHV
jgi:hypothetical protein